MKRICGLFLMLCFVMTVKSQTSWFLSSFKVVDNKASLEQILLLETGTSDELDDFEIIDNDKIAFTRFNGKFLVDFIAIERSVKGSLINSTHSISHFAEVPASVDHSFIIHGDKDQLARISNNEVSVITTASKILDYCWINPDIIAIISTDEEEKSTCSYLNINSDERKVISLNPGENVERISVNEIAFLDIFSSEYRYIKLHNIIEDRSRIVIKLPKETTRFTVQNDNQYFITQRNNLMRYIADKDVGWKPFFIFSAYPFNQINNLQYLDENRFIFSHNN